MVLQGSPVTFRHAGRTKGSRELDSFGRYRRNRLQPVGHRGRLQHPERQAEEAGVAGGADGDAVRRIGRISNAGQHSVVSRREDYHDSGLYRRFHRARHRLFGGEVKGSSTQAEVDDIHAVGHGIVYGGDNDGVGGVFVHGAAEDAVIAQLRGRGHPHHFGERRYDPTPGRHRRHEGPVAVAVHRARDIARFPQLRHVVARHDDLGVGKIRFSLGETGGKCQPRILQHGVVDVDARVDYSDFDSRAGPVFAAHNEPGIRRPNKRDGAVQQRVIFAHAAQQADAWKLLSRLDVLFRNAPDQGVQDHVGFAVGNKAERFQVPSDSIALHAQALALYLQAGLLHSQGAIKTGQRRYAACVCFSQRLAIQPYQHSR